MAVNDLMKMIKEKGFMNGPLNFSIVIPLYNKGSTIRRAILSVLTQTYPHFELIIVDDGSTDQSFESACAVDDPRIRIIRQENGGVSAARNRGIKEATYEWIAFLDADDEWKRGFLEGILDLMHSYTSCGVYASYYEMVFGGIRKPISYYKYYPPMWAGIIKDLFEVMSAGYPLICSAIVVNKDKLIEMGGFPEGVHNAEDLITWIRLSTITKISYLNAPLAIYNLQKGAKLNNAYRHLVRSQLIKTIEDMIISCQIKKVQERSARNLISKIQIDDTWAQLRLGNRMKALDLWIKSRKAKFIRKEWMILLLYIIFSKRTLSYIFTIKKAVQNIF